MTNPAQSSQGPPAIAGGLPVPYEFTDAALAERFADEALDGTFIYARGLRWLKWDGRRWRPCDISEPREAARSWVLAHYQAAVTRLGVALSSDDRSRITNAERDAKSWRTYQGKQRLDALVALGQGRVIRQAEDFDAYPDLLNCLNGTVSLRTGDLLPHDPGQLLTKLAPTRYVPGAVHPDWAAALEAVPQDIREWYQVRLGQGITGHMTPDDAIIFQQGSGRNGKSTLTVAAHATVGDYFLVPSQRALMADPSHHSTDLADFKGARLATVEELPEEGKLPVTRLKTLAGTPVITARFIAKDNITFYASHSLFVNTNYRPTVAETDDGTWRRLLLVHFPYRYVALESEVKGDDDRVGDPGIRERLRTGRAQHEAVLAWLVQGAIEWYRNGFPRQHPDRVIQDTLAWRIESDLIMGYISERLRFDQASHVVSAELVEDFNDWLEIQNHKKWGPRLFASRFGQHDQIRANRVEKTRIRRRPGLSRPVTSGLGFSSREPSSPYHAWTGVAFSEGVSLGEPGQEPEVFCRKCGNSVHSYFLEQGIDVHPSCEERGCD